MYSDNLYKDADEGVKLLTQLLNEEKNAVISEMTQRLNTAVLAHSANVAVKRELMNVGTAVNGIIDSLTGRQPPLDKQLSGPALRHGLNKLYYQVLNKHLNDRKVSKAPVDEQFVTKVQEAFTKAATAFVAKAEKYAAQLEQTLRRTVADDIEEQIKGEGGTTLQDHAKLGKTELKTVIDALTNDVMLAQHKRLGALKERYLENPETYAKMNAEDAIEKEFSFDESRQNIRMTMIASASERINTVVSWYNMKDEHGFDLHERHVQNELLHLRKEYPELNTAEAVNLAKATVRPVMVRINDYPILYSIGGKDKFTERVNQEVQTSSEAFMKTYMAFRDQFLKAAQPSLDKYSGLTKDVLEKKLAMTLESFSKAEKLPDLKVAVRAFDKMLSDTMNGVLDKTFAAYLEYSKAVTDAHENAIPVLNAEMDAHLDELKEAGATDEDVQFFRDTLASRLRERMETEICNNPKAWLGQEGKDKAATFFKETLDALKMEMSMMRLDPSKPEAFETQVRFFMELNGFREFMDDETTKAAVLENIKTWLKGDSVQQLMVEFRRAQMVTRVYGNDSGTQAVKDAKEVFNKFHAGIRAAVVGIQATILQGEFKNTQLEPALKLFDMWLEKYDLLTTPISRGKESSTLREMAKEHFTQRVHDLQQRMANEGKVSEPLLSQEYLTSFLQFINEHGTSVMLTEMEEKVKAQQMERLTGNSKSIYELDDIFSSERSTFIRNAVLVNNMGLRKLMDLNMKQVEKELRANPLSIEELQRWREAIETRFARQVRNINSFRMSCESRVMQMRQLSELTPKFMTFLNEALQERFGGKDITSREKIDEITLKNPKLGALLSELIATLGNLMAQKMSEKAWAIQNNALTEVKNPLKAQCMFLHDTEDNPALTNSFKELAHSLVKGASETKAYRNLFKQLDKELGVSSK